MNKAGRWLMDIADKFPAGAGNYCPPHYLPHKLPFGPKITDEPCHYHRAAWRMAHHRFFCAVLKCPHIASMEAAAAAK